MREISTIKQYFLIILSLLLFSSLVSAQSLTEMQKERKRLAEKYKDIPYTPPKSSKGLLTTDANKTVAELLEKMLGAGFVYGDNVYNAVLISPGNSNGEANGFFNGTGSNIGMTDGIIFTSGHVNTANGPNPSSMYNHTGGYGSGIGTDGDADLDALINDVTSCASGIEFDFIPENDTIQFDYVFGSEEYPEFINGGYNDVFAFFLSGPNPSGGTYDKVNLAIVPGTANTPVSIENVNEVDHSEYYVINQWNSGLHLTTVGLDGFTTVLTAMAIVTPCVEYHIKLVVADAGDNTWDSGVFLKSNSFASAPVEVVPVYANDQIPTAVEDCNEVSLEFTIPDEENGDITVPFTISGTATYGVDYTTDPVIDPDNGSIVIAAGTLKSTLTLTPLADGISEGVNGIETFVLEYSYDSPCSENPETSIITIEIADRTEVSLEPNPTGDIDIVCGETTTLEITASDGFPGYTYSWDTGESTTSIDVSPLDDTQYTITVNDECNSQTDYTFNVNVEQPVASITGVETICSGNDIELTASGGTTYLWAHGATTAVTTVSPTVTTDYTVTVTTSPGCFDSETVTVPVNPLPTVDHNDISGICIDVTDYELTGGSPDNGVYSGNHVSGGEFNAASAYAASGLGDYPVVYTFTDGNGCINDKTFMVNITDQIDVHLNNFNDICENASPIVLTGGDPVGGTFSGTGVDEVTGKFYPSQADIGLNLITYTYVSGSCSGNDAQNINVLAKPSVSLSPTQTEFCYNDNDFEIDGLSPTGGTLSGNGVTNGWFDPSAASVGTHNISYIIQGGNGCFNSTSTQFEVHSLPYVTFLNPFETQCSDNALYPLVEGFPADNGVYTGTGVVDHGDGTYSFDPSVGEGIYTITYTHEDPTTSCSKSKTQDIEVLASPIAATSVNIADPANQSFCLDNPPASITLVCTGPDDTYVWYETDTNGTSIGSGKSLTITTPTQTTTYLVRSETVECGNSSTKEITINVYASPVADFSVTDVCQSQDAHIDNYSTIPEGSIDSYAWDFGDGHTDNVENPADYQYAVAGTYTITLTLGSDHGCETVLQKDIEVFISPETPTGLSSTENAYCANSAPATLELSIGNTADHFKWYRNLISPDSLIGNTTSLTVNAPLVTTTYFVRSETEHCGNSVEKSITVEVFPTPQVAYDFSDNCQHIPVTFTDQSQISSGSIDSWSWDFGDGESATGSNPPPHAYATAGNYDTQLTIESDKGCVTISALNEIVIHPEPVADFGFSEACLGNATTFTNNSETFGSNSDSYNWDFNNGEGSSSDENPSFTFADLGTKNVSFEVSTEYGCKHSISKDVIVNSLPIANFDYNNPCKSNIVYFNDNSQGNGNTNIDWQWDFGNGDSASGQSPVYVYDGAPSFHTVVLSVTNNKGCVDTYSVNNIYVNPDFSVSIQEKKFCINRMDTLIAQSDDPNIIIDSWQWRIDGADYSTDQEIPLTYNTTGIHHVTLTGILNTNGTDCESADTYDLDVKNLPQVGFSFDTPNLDFPTHFTDMTTLDDPHASISSWSWDFDDHGAASAHQNPEYLFSTDGTYQVALTVLDDNTCEKTLEQPVLVNPKPTADYSFTEVCFGQSTQFTDHSITIDGTVYSYQWDFGDGTSSSLSSPSHKYAAPGTYTVELIVEEYGYDTITKDVIVYKLPEAQFSWSTPCLNQSIEFTDHSVAGDGDINSWSWSLSDGSNFTEQNPQHTFPHSGIFDISLLTVDEFGCESNITQSIDVKEPPVSGFEFNLNCLNSPTNFTELASDGDGSPITAYKWQFGDGTESTLERPSHTYTSPNTYTTQLTVTNADACEDTRAMGVTINPLPDPAYTITSNICQYEEVSFENQTNFQVPITSYEWDFGDATTYITDNQDVFTHIFNASGDHDILLRAIDEIGCSEEIIKTKFVSPDFTLDIDAYGLCTNTPVDFSGIVTDEPLSPDSWEWLFDDGSTASGQNIQHIFTQSGDHQVQLTASKSGCEEIYSEVFSIKACPTADFIYSLVSLDDTVQFQDASTLNGGPPIVSWKWDFGDPMSGLENTSTLKDPKHLFTHLGDFDVSLTVTDENGCSNTVIKTLTVNPRPVADFEWDQNCSDEDVQFTDLSTTSQGFITSWLWNFGDPASGAFNESTDQNPTHAFTSNGTFDVTLTVQAYGYGTVIKQVIISQGPTAEFTYNNPCQGDPVIFNSENSVSGDAPIVSWSWDFADGNTSNDQNPTHTYQFSGNYLVDLTVTDANGCKNTITHNVTIWQGPTAKFNYHSACTESLTYFIDKTIADGAEVTSWDWNFGDPASGGDNYSTEQNPSHAYTGQGNYTVTLIVEDANGCSNTISVDIVIEPSPTADFTADAVCMGESMIFTDQSYSDGQPIISWYWEFGDGATSTTANPIHTYSSAGNYDVLLVVETAGGCSNEIVKEVNIFYLPTADFIWSGGQACANDTTQFTDMSSPTGSAVIDTWFWQFGDGTTSDEQHPMHYFANAGNYAVNLIITDINGCQSNITKNVVVSQAPVSNFTYVNPDCDLVNFTSTGYDPNGLNIISWYWDFGDPASGANNISTEQNPDHQYVNGGSYQVMHIITNESYCVDTIEQEVIISKPQAEFSFSASCANVPVNFTDESVSTSDPVVSWTWNFSDGETSDQQNPSHVFTLGGSYLVNLTITTAGGCNSQIAHEVVVSYGPTTNFTHTSIQCTSDSIQFTDVSSGDAPLSSWEWQFGDGNTSNLQHPKHAYANPGNYLVTLRVTDESGCYSDKTEDLEIFQSPDANFNWDIVNCDTTFFTDYSNDNGSSILAWTWTFDDPASGTENISFLQNPNHKFTTAGNYQVALTVSNQYLCADTLTQQVAYDALVMPDFEFDTVCYGDSTHFTDLTPTDFQTILSWEWQFGDGSISHEQHPVHKYLLPGVYETKLIIINSNFCSDSIIKEVLVRELPVVNFAPDSSCFGQEVPFTDLSNSSGEEIISWNWQFGDGGSSTEQNPLHSYAAEGTYQVTLEIENNFGCTDSLVKAHYVNPLPVVDFTNDTVCLGTITLFNNLTTSAIGIQGYAWDFGDGEFSTATHPSHNYAIAGDYQVKLVATDVMGCTDSIIKTVTVYETPAIDFEATTVCLGDSTEFTDLSAGAVSWNWNFGDGGTSMLSNPKHLYDNAGTYSVLLEIEDSHTCSNSVVKEVEVLPLPIVDFNWNFSACAGDTTFFHDLSQGINTDITSWLWSFGDGETSTEQHPWHIYPASDDLLYEVTLVVTTATNCVDSLMQEVVITGAPQAAFSFTNNPDQGPCINNLFAFTDESSTQSGLIQSWHWDFGDTQTSESQNPSHFFTTAGSFTVSLTVSNTAGCEMTTSQDIEVFDLPVVDFSFDSVCLGDTTHFMDSDMIEVLATQQWQYIFGDGNTASVSDPTHIFAGSMNYNVILQITDTNLCSNQIAHEVPVYGLPQVNFTYDTACLGLPTQFTDLSTLADHELDSWHWYFGDGAEDNIQNPQHIYSDFNTYAARLVVSDTWGCTDSLQKQVAVYEPPISDFIWSDTSCTSGLVYFTNESYHNQGFEIVEYNWTMDGFTTNTENTQYTFPLVDVSYPVSLAVTDARGCTDTSYQDVIVRPKMEISILADTVCFKEGTQLIAQIDEPDDNQVHSWTWYFDDGSEMFTTNQDTIYHIFSAAGIFKVELEASNQDDCTAKAESFVKVRGLPVADYIAEAASCADSTEFINETIISEGNIEEWTWGFGDGSSQTVIYPENPDVKHWYPPYFNVFETSLRVMDEYGCADTLFKNVQRYPCIFVNFYSDTNLYCQNKAVMLIDSSIVDDGSTVLDKYWNFGDGSELTTGPEVDTVTHIYENTGTYTISYAMSFDVDGITLSDTMRKDITVFPTPVAAMLARNICDKEKALLVSNISANQSIVDSWTWYFGDGSDTTIVNDNVSNAIYHTYPHSGAYDLQLTTVTDLGCRDTAFRDFIVNPTPEIFFVADTNVLCGPGSILFTDSSQLETGSITQRYWSFGDGHNEGSSLDTISHYFVSEYLETELYTVTLSATSDSACTATDSVVDMIKLLELPHPEFTVFPDSVPITEIQNMVITNYSDNAYYYNWVMSDTIFWDAYEPDIYEEIKDTGRYKLQLHAQSPEGCWDSTESYFKVYPVLRFFMPTAFSPNDNGLNETFGPAGKYFQDKSFKFRIFNRWGELMFETNNFYEQWDGRKQKDNSVCPIGVYTWVIEVADLQGNTRVHKGAVTLVL